MKKFILLSQAHTKITSSDLQSQGRLDIVLHSIITSLFASHTFREDTILEIILMGPPEKPRKITFYYNKDHSISKKNLKKSIEIALKKCNNKKDPKHEIDVIPGVKVCEINVDEYLTQYLENREKFCCILDSYGKYFSQYSKDISKILTNNHERYKEIIYFLGDHDGITKQIKKKLKKESNRISLGEQMYFTSQVCTILHYEMDILSEKSKNGN